MLKLHVTIIHSFEKTNYCNMIQFGHWSYSDGNKTLQRQHFVVVMLKDSLQELLKCFSTITCAIDFVLFFLT